MQRSVSLLATLESFDPHRQIGDFATQLVCLFGLSHQFAQVEPDLHDRTRKK